MTAHDIGVDSQNCSRRITVTRQIYCVYWLMHTAAHARCSHFIGYGQDASWRSPGRNLPDSFGKDLDIENIQWFVAVCI